MSLFRKKHIPPQGRQRPSSDDNLERANPAFSYYGRGAATGDNTGRGQAPIERIDMRGPRRKLIENQLVLTLGSFIVLGLLAYMLALGGQPKIVALTASGSTYFLEDNKTYQQTAARSIARSVINTNKLTIDTNRIARDIKQNHAEIETVTVGMPFFGRSPIIYVKPYTPSFILTTSDSKAFLLDTNGRALVSVSQITDSGELAVPTLQDKSNLGVRLGTQALPSGTVTFGQAVTRALDAKKVAYSSLVLPAADNQLDVYITGRPYYVKFDVQGDPLQQAGTYLATKQRLERERITPAEYIDVRVPERAYYK